MEPTLPPGRLLGGATTNPKPSKLAALAAARKKKQESARSETPTSQSSNSAIALLDKLTLNATDHGKGQSSSLADTVTTDAQPVERNLPIRKSSPKPAQKTVEQIGAELPATEQKPPESPQPLLCYRAEPSAFARTLCGLDLAPPNIERIRMLPMEFPLPYLTIPEYANSNPFAGPSPDDIVLNAQAKGLGKI
jgi:elongation factor 1 alpha-like protein